MFTQTIVGKGRNANEALLFARVNQIGYDEGLKENTITMRPRCIEIPSSIPELECDGNRIITALHFARKYYVFQQNQIKYGDSFNGEFTECEYKHYSILIKKIGGKLIREIMTEFENEKTELCVGVKTSENYYKFLY